MDINLEYYKIFYYVGKLKSITLAAEELSISQPAVSQAIKQLENTLGSALFVRTSRGVRFTAEGEVLYSYIKRGYETIRFGEKKFLELLDLEEGELCIGASDMTLQFYLLEHLEKFHEKYPKIRVTVKNAPTPKTLKMLQEGVIDFGVVSTPISKRMDLKFQKVRDIQDIFVVGKKFQKYSGKQMSYQELERLPLICLEGVTSTRAYVEKFLKEQGVSLRPEFELATSAMLIQFAVKGFGVASVVEDFALEALEKGEIFCLQFDRVIPKRHFCIVTDEKIPISAAAKRFLELL
ncbi:MAG: LysR family transcriptional regulator [Lachnospiraceae bacterium]|nr:LysR family transcriptional regulator [Lachnospiraceae bacterium]